MVSRTYARVRTLALLKREPRADSKPIAYLMRHAGTDLNAGDIIRSWSDTDINAEGRKQARAAGKFLKGKGIERAVSSDLPRAKHTMQIAARVAGIESRSTDAELRAWKLGDLQGKSKKDNQEKLDRLVENPDQQPPGEGESLNEFRQRKVAALKKHLQTASPEDPLLIVEHNSGIICDEEHLSGRQNAKASDVEVVRPGGIVAVYQDGDGYRTAVVFGEKKKGDLSS